MKAAIIHANGQPPVYGDFAEPQAAAGETLVTIAAAAISPIVKSRASGAHYSATNGFPFIVGLDGVGRREDGSRVYFVLPRTPYGSMAERSVVPSAQCVTLPAELDDVTAAAIANPGMSSWAAYSLRAKLQPGETVLVNGATGCAGRLAVQIAKHLGAGKVIATGRDPEALQSLAALGADELIPLAADRADLDRAFRPAFAAGVDVVIDYLWGDSAEAILIAAAREGADGVPIRYIQVGSASGSDITLPSAVLRSSALAVMGSGIGSIGLEKLIDVTSALFAAAAAARFRIATTIFPLSEIERGWSIEGGHQRVTISVGS
jgi:NADPH:quinone reductase-like Zn-dependent oxidoreductase